jgi:hypothetical protein
LRSRPGRRSSVLNQREAQGSTTGEHRPGTGAQAGKGEHRPGRGAQARKGSTGRGAGEESGRPVVGRPLRHPVLKRRRNGKQKRNAGRGGATPPPSGGLSPCLGVVRACSCWFAAVLACCRWFSVAGGGSCWAWAVVVGLWWCVLVLAGSLPFSAVLGRSRRLLLVPGRAGWLVLVRVGALLARGGFGPVLFILGRPLLFWVGLCLFVPAPGRSCCFLVVLGPLYGSRWAGGRKRRSPPSGGQRGSGF